MCFVGLTNSWSGAQVWSGLVWSGPVDAPIPLTGAGLEFGRAPPREKLGFESCKVNWLNIYFIFFSVCSTFLVAALLSGKTFLTKTGKFLKYEIREIVTIYILERVCLQIQLDATNGLDRHLVEI